MYVGNGTCFCHKAMYVYVVNGFSFLRGSHRLIMLSGGNTNLCSISHSV